jgi:predicted N-acetyltransferase YhbS
VTRYARIEPITADHDAQVFDCGSDDQTAWLRNHALQAHRSDTAKVYVVCRQDSRAIAGYYALSASSVAAEDAPSRVSQGAGQYPVPVIALARLGVNLADQGDGLGSALVKDAFLQVASVADRVGVRALLIHAETPAAAAFYTRIDGGFEPSASDPLHLLLLMKDLRRAMRDATSNEARRVAVRPIV